jgi:hypothetical protein
MSETNGNQGTNSNNTEQFDDDTFDEILKCAITNIKHCVKRVTGFKDASVQNFKNNYKKFSEILQDRGVNATTWQGWMIQISHLAEESQDQDLMELAQQTFSFVMDKIEDYPTEIEVWKQKQPSTGISSNTKGSPNIPPNINKNNYSNEPKPTKKAEQTVDNNSDNTDIREWVRKANLRIDPLRDSSQEIISWFKKFEIQTMGWNDSERGYKILAYLDDDALNKYSEMSENIESYSAIKEYLIKRLRDKESEEWLKNFYNAEQRCDETVDQFCTRLHNYQNEMESKEQEIVKTYFTSIFRGGLLPEIRQALIGIEDDFNKLFKAAKDAEKIETHKKLSKSRIEAIQEPIASINNKFKKLDVKESKHEQYKKKKQCKICDKTNHSTDECFKLPALRQNANRNNLARPNQRTYSTRPGQVSTYQRTINNDSKFCSHCDKSGHTYTECKSRTGKCFSCGSTQHKIRDCPKKNLN